VVAVPRLVKSGDVSLMRCMAVLVACRLAARCLLRRSVRLLASLACVCVCLAGLRPRDWLVLGPVHGVGSARCLARLPAGVQVFGLVLLAGEFG
jgi:hypothetical protein